MKKIFAEIGFGNDTFLSTKTEEGDSEYRVGKSIRPNKINSYYLRIWLWKKVFIFSTKNGFEIVKKDRNKFKFLFGVGGEEE